CHWWRGGGTYELQLELGNLFSAFAGRHPHLLAAVVVRRRLDTGDSLRLSVFLGSLAGRWLIRFSSITAEKTRSAPPVGCAIGWRRRSGKKTFSWMSTTSPPASTSHRI